MSSSLGPRVGIWGTFDVAEYGDLLLPRIFEHELRRRLPYARIYPYAPLGAEHPIGMDGGRPAAPLGAWTRARRAQLAEQLDLVAVSGSDVIHVRDDLHHDAYAEAAPGALPDFEPSRFFVDGLGAELERRCPVVWHAVGVPFEFGAAEAARVRDALVSKRYVSARDELSRERLLATGTEQDIAVVPDPVVLVARLFAAPVLEKRLEYLRAVDCYPRDDAPLVVQGGAVLARHVDRIAETLSQTLQRRPELPIVLVALDRGGAEFAEALASRLDGPVSRLPAAVTLEDLVAAIASARGFAGSSRQGYLTARAFGVPGVHLSGDPAELEQAIMALPDAETDESAVRVLADAVDEQFDTLAAIAEESWSKRLAASADADADAAELARNLAEAERRHDALLRAYAARGERLLAERLRVAEILDAKEAVEGADVRLRALLELAEARNRLEILDAEAAAARFERDQGRAELERIRAERDELRKQLAQALAEEHRPTRFRRLLPRRA
jgi:hypothetical protein